VVHGTSLVWYNWPVSGYTLAGIGSEVFFIQADIGLEEKKKKSPWSFNTRNLFFKSNDIKKNLILRNIPTMASDADAKAAGSKFASHLIKRRA
jgi:hypothetical protein